MRRRRARVVVGASLIVAGALVYWLVFAHGWAYLYGARMYIESTKYEDFSLSGDVVDESGAPIGGVTVAVIAAERRGMGTEEKYDTEYVRVEDGTFSFDLRDYSSVDLRFRREGYQPETLAFAKGGDYHNLRVVMRRSPPASSPSSTQTDNDTGTKRASPRHPAASRGIPR
jgi:hypothetical protein